MKETLYSLKITFVLTNYSHRCSILFSKNRKKQYAQFRKFKYMHPNISLKKV